MESCETLITIYTRGFHKVYAEGNFDIAMKNVIAGDREKRLRP